MTINAILNTALSALQTSQAALRTTSSNITNVNTEGYQRRVVQQQAAVVGGQLAGVEISEVRRMAATFFARESLDVTSLAAKADAQAQLHDRIQTLLGDPNGNTSTASQITSLMSAFGQAAIDPSSIVRRNAVLSSLGQLATSYTQTASQLQALRADAETQITGVIGKVNALIERIDGLNPQIAHEVLAGNNATGLMDQRDAAIRELASYIDIRVQDQPDGRAFVSTPSGLSLVSDLRVRLDYVGPPVVASGTVFPSIMAQRVNPRNGQDIGQPIAFEQHLQAGELAGLLDMRNNTLPKLAEELGMLAGALGDQINAVHNDATAVPAPGSMTGRNTGLLAADALNFTGQTTLAITANDSTLVRRVDIDFDAGTYSVDGGGAVAFGGTIGALVTALNTGLTGVGSVSFTNGVITVSATGTDGVAFLQDETNPSARGGRGFAHFFGLNDLVEARRSFVTDTGFTGTEAHGFTAGQIVDFSLRGPRGDVALSTTLTVAGATIDDLVAQMNTQFAGFASFNLDSAGHLVMTTASGYEGYRLEVGADDTTRGGTGISFSKLFGLGTQAVADQAADYAIRGAMLSTPALLGFAKLSLTPTTLPGAIVLGIGDSRGATALQDVETTAVNFRAAGFLGAMGSTIGEYASTFLADAGQRAALAEGQASDLTALKTEVFERRGSIEGVNLDEELANLMQYQQAYNASARIFRVAQDLYDALLNIV